MKPRTRARCTALQALYEIDLVGHPLEFVLLAHSETSSLNNSLFKFSEEIVRGVWPRIEILDQFIAEHAPEWPLDQVSIIDRNIIRIALWEFAVYKETPIKVAINEAVELAKVYGSDSTPRFVNGVLGSLSDRQNEIQQAIQKHFEIKE